LPRAPPPPIHTASHPTVWFSVIRDEVRAGTWSPRTCRPPSYPIKAAVPASRQSLQPSSRNGSARCGLPVIIEREPSQDGAPTRRVPLATRICSRATSPRRRSTEPRRGKGKKADRADQVFRDALSDSVQTNPWRASARRRHRRWSWRRAVQKVRPGLHQRPALVELVALPINPLNIATNNVGKSHFRYIRAKSL
jgi:hypothetical protein